jgi:hypothetical protein
MLTARSCISCFGTQLSLVDIVDTTWQNYGIAQNVEWFSVDFMAIWSNVDTVDPVVCNIWQKTKHWLQYMTELALFAISPGMEPITLPRCPA